MAARRSIGRILAEEPAFPKAFIGDVRWAWFWLIVRLYVGWTWLTAGWEKVNDPTWVGSQAGVALSGFLNHAVTLATGAHPSVQSWYAGFIQSIVLPQVTVWSYVVAFGELLVGVGLILGMLTGLAAFFGGFMSFNYLLAGTVSVNAILLVMEIGLVLAWRIAGWWGLDRWLMPAPSRELRGDSPQGDPEQSRPRAPRPS